MSEAIFRGSWVPAAPIPKNQRFFCPYCGQMVYMYPGTPTYPTCPWCISDMPEADDFKAPEDLYAPKLRGETHAMPAEAPAPVGDEAINDYQRRYYELNKDMLDVAQRDLYERTRKHQLERKSKYIEEHRDEINKRAREARASDPERFKAYAEKHKQKSMREVEAHIRGVSADDIPKNGFYFGKGVKR